MSFRAGGATAAAVRTRGAVGFAPTEHFRLRVLPIRTQTTTGPPQDLNYFNASSSRIASRKATRIGVGIFPEREKVCIGRTRSGRVAGHDGGAREAKVCERVQGGQRTVTPVFEDSLKLGFCFGPIVRGQIGLAPQGLRPELGSRFITAGFLQQLNRLGRVVATDLDSGANRGQTERVDQRIFRIPLRQFINQGLHLADLAA